MKVYFGNCETPLCMSSFGDPRDGKTRFHTESVILFWPNGILFSCRRWFFANCYCESTFLFLYGLPLRIAEATGRTNSNNNSINYPENTHCVMFWVTYLGIWHTLPTGTGIGPRFKIWLKTRLWIKSEAEWLRQLRQEQLHSTMHVWVDTLCIWTYLGKRHESEENLPHPRILENVYSVIDTAFFISSIH
jgi:hypothetical protein